MTPTELLAVIRARHLLRSGAGREARVRSGLSLADVSAACGVSMNTLWRWEHGDRSPRPAAALRYLELVDGLLSLESER